MTFSSVRLNFFSPSTSCRSSLIRFLRIAGKRVEARLQAVAGAVERLLEQLVLAFVLLAQGDERLEQAINRGHPHRRQFRIGRVLMDILKSSFMGSSFYV